MLERLILAGIGTMAYSYEKAAGLIDQLIKKGELTVSQGRELNAELKRRAAHAPAEMPPAGLEAILTTLDDLRARLDRIEEKLEH